MLLVTPLLLAAGVKCAAQIQRPPGDGGDARVELSMVTGTGRGR